MAEQPTHLFLAPHYDDVALSCGGTVAQLSESGASTVIITIFGGLPSEPLTLFASNMHALWGVGPHDVIATRREEERCAAERLGARTIWLEFADAIYREDRYTSDPQLFGTIHPTEADLAAAIYESLRATFTQHHMTPASVYVPLAIGNHVDHQHVLSAGRMFVAAGVDVWAYEDFPYAGDPEWRATIEEQARASTSGESRYTFLTPAQINRRIEAVGCYRSQLEVIFRHQGDPASAIRDYAATIGDGRPAERFWSVKS